MKIAIYQAIKSALAKVRHASTWWYDDWFEFIEFQVICRGQCHKHLIATTNHTWNISTKTTVTWMLLTDVVKLLHKIRINLTFMEQGLYILLKLLLLSLKDFSYVVSIWTKPIADQGLIGEIYTWTSVAKETNFYVVWTFTWMEKSTIQKNNLKKMKLDQETLLQSKLKDLRKPKVDISFAQYIMLLCRRGPGFAAKCCEIHQQSSTPSLSEKYVVSNDLISPCSSYDEATIIILSVLVALLMLAIFICMANLFW